MDANVYNIILFIISATNFVGKDLYNLLGPLEYTLNLFYNIKSGPKSTRIFLTVVNAKSLGSIWFSR